MATESMSSFSSQNTSRYQNTSHGLTPQQFSTNQWQQQQQQQSHLYYHQNQQHWAKYYHTSATVPKRYYHYRHLTGKGLKDATDSDKKDSDSEGLWAVDASTAFLGPNIWDKTLAGEGDLKYVDLDEFLSENGIPLEHPISPTQQNSPPSARCEGGEGPSNLASRRGVTSELHINTNTKRERSPSPSYDPELSPSSVGPPSPTDSTVSFSSTNGPDFDPRTRTFSDEELKPQPMIKKSRKQILLQLVPDGLKDEKYWARRRKNNMAAKRSRDARRVKENQIALRAGFLEKENMTLKQENEKLKKENVTLKNKLEKKSN